MEKWECNNRPSKIYITREGPMVARLVKNINHTDKIEEARRTWGTSASSHMTLTIGHVDEWTSGPTRASHSLKVRFSMVLLNIIIRYGPVSMNSQYLDTDMGRTMMYTNQRCMGIHSAILLFLHGGPGSPDPYVVDELDYSGFIYTYDQFGCGESDKKQRYDPDLFVEQLRRVMESLSMSGPIILMGASWGGTLACLYIRKYGTENIKALILASPCINWKDSDRYFKEVINSLPEPIRNEIRKAEETLFFGETYALAHRAFYKEEYGRHDSEESCDCAFQPVDDVIQQMLGDDEAAGEGALKEVSVEDVLKSLDIPVLYISGDNDIHKAEDIRRYASLIPDVELHILEDTGHYINSHPDYKSIIKDFTERVDPDKYVADPTGFSLQDDYDMILNHSPHDTRRNLERDAAKLSVEECLGLADRYEKGDGVPQSFFSAKILLIDVYDRVLSAFSVNGLKEFQRIDYDASNPHRKLLISPRGVESTCCYQLRNALSGSRWSESDAKVVIREDGQGESQMEIDECPFCGCRLALMHPRDVKEISSDDEFITTKEQYNRHYYDPEDSLSMYMSLRNYSEKKLPLGTKLLDRIERISSKLGEMERERLRNVTGVLTRSSAGFESACCKEFSENYHGTVEAQYDTYYADIELKDGRILRQFKFCPYCNSRMKRVPRTY